MLVGQGLCVIKVRMVIENYYIKLKKEMYVIYGIHIKYIKVMKHKYGKYFTSIMFETPFGCII